MMITNAEIKLIRSLRDKKFRDESGLFIVEGEKLVQEALKSGFAVEKVWRREDVGEEIMSRISATSSPSPALAVVRKPAVRQNVAVGGLCLALDSVRDPGNMGTIIRVADWFGVDCLYLSPDCVDIYNPKVVQSTMGSIFRRHIETADLPELCRIFKRAGYPVMGTFLDGENIYSASIGAEGLLVMGNESDGISNEVAAEVTSRLFIPPFDALIHPESLNVAAATALSLYELRRPVKMNLV